MPAQLDGRRSTPVPRGWPSAACRLLCGSRPPPDFLAIVDPHEVPRARRRHTPAGRPDADGRCSRGRHAVARRPGPAGRRDGRRPVPVPAGGRHARGGRRPQPWLGRMQRFVPSRRRPLLRHSSRSVLLPWGRAGRWRYPTVDDVPARDRERRGQPGLVPDERDARRVRRDVGLSRREHLLLRAKPRPERGASGPVRQGVRAARERRRMRPERLLSVAAHREPADAPLQEELRVRPVRHLPRVLLRRLTDHRGMRVAVAARVYGRSLRFVGRVELLRRPRQQPQL
jgi:hypothetical protein